VGPGLAEGCRHPPPPAARCGSEEMFTAVKQAHPPTTVDFALPCSLVAGGRRNLAVVKNTVLELYELRVQSDDTQPDQPISYARLELRHSTALFGKVAQIAAIRPSGCTTDRLLLAFDYGNLSIVAWDPVRFDFSTVAIQSFADSSMLVGRGQAVMIPPKLRSDPQNRCAAMLVHGLRLHVVAIGAQYQRIHMDDALAEEEGDEDGNYVIDLEAMGITDIMDFQFLEGTLEPTISILYGTPTWTGRLATGRATMAVRTLSLSLPTKEQTEIWSATDLPYNATGLTPVAPPFGGVMLVANNTIWYLNTSTRIAVAVNEFGLDDLHACKVSASLGGPHDLSDVAISLAACCVSFLDGTHALFNLSRGQMFCVELVTEVRSVVSFAINREAAGVLVSCTCKLSDQLVFLGSRLADSQLVEFKRQEENADEEAAAAAATQSAASILQAMEMNQSVKEALNLILMELRVALDRATTKTAVGEAITQAEPKFDGFLAEHGADLGGLREVCKKLLISCGWDVENDRWSGGDDAEEVKAEGEGGEEKAESDWAGKTGAIAQLDEAIESLSVFKRRRVGKAATDFDEDLFGTMDLQSKRDVSGLPSGHSQIKSTKTFAYTPWDTLPNIGPISDFAVGKSPLSAEGGGRLEDIVTCSGNSKNGALYVLHRDLRPQVLNTIPLPGCRAIWSVQHMKTQESWNLPKPEPEEEGEEEEEEEPVYHAFVLLSMEETDQTMVLKAGTDGLNTLDGDMGGFVIDEETVMAGNAAAGRYIIQICRSKVVLLDDSLGASVYTVESDSADASDVPPFICSAAISDPYILLHLSNSSSVLLKANPTTGKLERISVQFGEANITSVTLFEDLNSTWLYTWASRTVLTGAAPESDEAPSGALKQEPGTAKAESAPVADSATSAGMDVELDDEEMDIFGDSEPSAKPETAAMLEDTAAVKTESAQAPVLPNRHFCVISREAGVVEIFLIIEEEDASRLERVFLCDGVPLVCSNLHDSRVGAAATRRDSTLDMSDGAPGLARVSSTGAGLSSAEIREMHVHVLDEDLSRPVMACVLDTGDVLLHRAYSYDATEGDLESGFVSGQKPIAFSAIEHDHLFAPTKREREALQAEGGDGEQVITAGTMMTSRVVPFDRVGGNAYEAGHSGFFIGGARPAWVMCEKECVRVHPMRTDGNVRSFSGLHIPPTEQAFVTLNTRSELKICKLQPDVQYGGPWPCRKIGLKATAHKVVYHEGTQTYAVVTSKQMQAEKPTKPQVTNEDGVVEEVEEEVDEGPRAKRLPRIAEQFEVRLLAPQRDWNCVDKYEFKADEHVLVIRNLKLTEAKQDKRQEKQVQMLGIGTGMCAGEDKSCEGRLMLLAVESTLSGEQIVEQYAKEEKGPVCSMAQLQSEFVVATAGTGIDPNHRGATIIVHKFKTDDEGKGRLTPAAFYHNEVFSAHLTTIKGTNIILMGDPCKSINCLIWKAGKRSIELLARDYQSLEVDASTFVLDGSKRLNIMCSDHKENLQIFTLPTAAAGLGASGKGKRLQVTGQFHLGTKVLQFALHHLEADDSDGSGVAHDPKKLAVIYTGLDGSIGTMI
jgi:hypothetical protein